jgi:hypothetical protein
LRSSISKRVPYPVQQARGEDCGDRYEDRNDQVV